MDRLLPRMILQPGCNHSLFGVGCGLNQSDWEFDGQVASVDGGWPYAVTIGDIERSNGGSLPDIGVGWFGGGWIRFGSGSASRSVPIVSSTAESGGSITVTLSRPPFPAPDLGEEVSLLPGCDGVAGTCQTKFANWLNFGGHPLRPIANPSLVRVSGPLAGGKK